MCGTMREGSWIMACTKRVKAVVRPKGDILSWMGQWVFQKLTFDDMTGGGSDNDAKYLKRPLTKYIKNLTDYYQLSNFLVI